MSLGTLQEKDLQWRFGRRGETRPEIVEMRAAAMAFAVAICRHTVEGREQMEAKAKLEEALAWATAAFERGAF